MNGPVSVVPFSDNIANNVYLNLQIRGTNTGDAYNPHAKMYFYQSFNEAFIKEASNYYSTICTLTIPCHSVPLVYFVDIQSGAAQTDPNLSSYYLSFGYGGNFYGSYVSYVPPNDISVPLAPSTNSSNGYVAYYSPYYNISNYQTLCLMFNNTLSSTYTAMFTANPALAGLGLTVNDSPYFIFDDSSNKFSLVYNKLFVGSGVSLFYNDVVSIKFPGFYSYFYGVKGNQRDYMFRLEDTKNNTYDTNNFYNRQMYAGSPSILGTINQVVLASSNARSRGEYVVSNNNNGTLSLPSVLYSFNPDLVDPISQKTKLTYVANGNYRLSDVIGNGEMRSIDVSLYYTDNAGNAIPFTLSPSETATVKFLFVKRSLYNNW